MSRTLTGTFHLIHKRNVLLIAAIGAFGYLASVAASPLASLFLIKAVPPESQQSKLLHFAWNSGVGGPASSLDTQALWFVARGYPFESSTRPPKRKRKSARTTRKQRTLYDEISEQRRLLSQLELEVEGRRLMDLVADSDLLLILNQHISNHLNFINRRLNPPSESKLETSLHKNFVAGNKIAANVILDTPNTIDLTQTENVQVSINWTFPDQETLPKELPVISPKLESPDFKIVAAKPDGAISPITNFGSRTQTWVWLISPEKTGDREITLSFSGSNGKPVPILIGEETKDYRILLPIKVLTELGLTSTQSAWAKAIGALIGIIGTIAGYSFWRNRTRKRKPSQDSPGDDDESKEVLDAEIILRELARHLRKQEALTQSGDNDTSRNAEGAKDDPPQA